MSVQEKTETIVTEGSLKRPGGFYANIPSREYHSSPGLSYSGLKNYAVSPAYYKAMRECERDRDKVETLIHLILEGKELFEESVKIVGDRRTKAGKEAMAEAEDEGLIPVSTLEYDQCQLVRHSVETDLDAGPLLRMGLPEVSMYWEHSDVEGLLCRGRGDRVIQDVDVIVDWKCVGAVLSDLGDSPTGLPALIYRNKWHWQASFYSDGYQSLTSRRPEFANVFIDHRNIWRNRVPILVKAMDEASMDFAKEHYMHHAKAYYTSLSAGNWSGISTIGIPERYFL